MVNGLPDVTRVVFDDERVVANAGVLLPAVLADRLGLEALIDRTVDLGDRPGGSEPRAQSDELGVGNGAGCGLHRGLRRAALGAHAGGARASCRGTVDVG